jgi:cell division septation protein DedD
MRLGFMNRLRNGYGNIYTPHAGSMIIQVQRETGLANRTIVLSQRQVAFLRIVGSRVGLAIGAVFIATWLLFAAQSVRVPVLSVRIAELERDNRRIDSLQVALSRMHGRYEQVRQMLAVGGSTAAPQDTPPAAATKASPNAKRADEGANATSATPPDTTSVTR